MGHRAARMSTQAMNALKAAVGKLFNDFVRHKRSVQPVEAAIAASIVIAHELLHDGATEDDMIKIARMAWEKARDNHKRCTS